MHEGPLHPTRSENLCEGSPEVQRAFDKQVNRLLVDPHHPSLRTKKYDEASGLWQARINRDWRFYFTIEGETYHLVEMTSHPK